MIIHSNGRVNVPFSPLPFDVPKLGKIHPFISRVRAMVLGGIVASSSAAATPKIREYSDLTRKVFFDFTLKVEGDSPPTLDEHDFRIVADAAKVQEKLVKEREAAASQPDPDKGRNSVRSLRERPFYEIIGATGVAHAVGERPTQEDTHTISQIDFAFGEKNFTAQLTAIFDGHGGGEASEFCARNIKTAICRRLNEFSASLQDWDSVIWNALKLSCVDLDRACGGTSGTTANIVLRIGSELWVANVGDSRAVLVDRKGKGTSLSEDAKLDYEKYVKGVEKRHGKVYKDSDGDLRINNSLAVARAIGDHHLQGAANPRPKIVKVQLPDNATGFHLLQCCDGIFDIGSSKEVAEMLHYCGKNKAVAKAIAIVRWAYAVESTDNLTALVTRL
jgi:serine/threonine protein phosphatase PrpC